jgi:uncharacterized membrane protein YfbV (UPF0208 family)
MRRDSQSTLCWIWWEDPWPVSGRCVALTNLKTTFFPVLRNLHHGNNSSSCMQLLMQRCTSVSSSPPQIILWLGKRVINTVWTQVIRAFSNIYLKTKQHTDMKLTPLKGELKNKFCSLREKWRHSNDSYEDRNCWHGSKMAIQPEKANWIPT